MSRNIKLNSTTSISETQGNSPVQTPPDQDLNQSKNSFLRPIHKEIDTNSMDNTTTTQSESSLLQYNDGNSNTKQTKPSTPTESKGATPSTSVLPAFLTKTFEIFSMPEFSSMCGWNPSGDTIIVSQLEQFVSTVLPRFFKHRNFPSFVRQLNLYGFHKTVLDSKRLEFQHPYFKRNRPDLLVYIKRKSSSSSQLQQHQANIEKQNSRLDAHRSISDNLLREMKELKKKSESMEARLRELEVDNAIVRSDNVKLWNHLEAAKDKQLIMQEKMKKIMWILFQIYRGRRPSRGNNLPSSSDNTTLSDEFLPGSKIGPNNDFREVLHFLALDDTPLLPSSAPNEDIGIDGATAPLSRKRKFVEMPFDSIDQLDVVPAPPNKSLRKFKLVDDAASSALDTFPLPPALQASNSALSLFSPPSRSLVQQQPLNVSPGSLLSDSGASSNAASAKTVDTGTASSSPLLDLSMDGPSDMLLLTDHPENLSKDEQTVMQKLEDFEASLLDEYDVGCLDTLLKQLKNSTNEKTAAELSDMDPDQILVDETPQNLTAMETEL